jgi:hypothetical protein
MLILVEGTPGFRMGRHDVSTNGARVGAHKPSPDAFHVKHVLSGATKLFTMYRFNSIKTDRTLFLTHVKINGEVVLFELL